MQGLLIATNVIGVITCLLCGYTVIIFHKVSKLDNDNQYKFCKTNSKQFIIFLIISVLLFVGNIIGLTLLAPLSSSEGTEIIFPTISLSISIFPIIIFFTFLLYAKKNHYTEKQMQGEKMERKTQLDDEEYLRSHFQQVKENLQQIKENGSVLIKKYAFTVENLIDKLTQIHNGLFVNMFSESYSPISSILTYPYRNINSRLFKNAIKKDGLIFAESANKDLNTCIYNIIEPYVEKLKEELFKNNEWTDESTAPLLIYRIIRNNIIKHYHDVCISKVGYENLEEFCLNISNPIREIEITTYLSGEEIKYNILIANKVDTVWFIYYYIYEHDIDLPFVETYKKLCAEMQQTIEKQKEQKKYEDSEKLKKELFGSHKVKNEPTINTVRYISPIEKVDNMTGEQFELFMTQYFAEYGFKATHTPLSGDFGIDLILENDFGKIGVQLKCYSQKVPQDAIREVVAGLKHYGLSSGMVVTNNYFQPAAIQLAKDNNVTLWDRNKLIEKLGQ